MESETRCDPCECRGLKEPAVKYCKSCQEAQCSVCAEVHRSSKATRDHWLVDVSMSKSLCKLGSDLEELQTCSRHTGKELEFYCGEHNTLLCSFCLFTQGDHRECANIVAISTAGDYMMKCGFTSKTAKHLTDLKQQSKRAMLKLKELAEVSHTNVELVKDKIQEVRESLLRAFDEQAETVMQNATSICDNYRKKCSDQLHELKTLVVSLENSTDLFSAVLEKERPADVFRCLISLHEQLEEFNELSTKTTKGISRINIVVKKWEVRQNVVGDDSKFIDLCTEEKQIAPFDHCLFKPTRDEFYGLITQCCKRDYRASEEKLDVPEVEEKVEVKPDNNDYGAGIKKTKRKKRSVRIAAAKENTKQEVQTITERHISEQANTGTNKSRHIAKSSDDCDGTMRKEAEKLGSFQENSLTKEPSFGGDSEIRPITAAVIGGCDNHSKCSVVGNEKEPVTTDDAANSNKNCKLIIKHAFSFEIPAKDHKHNRAKVYGGIVCLANKRLVISNLTNSSLLIIDAENGSILREITTKYPPGSMSVLNENTLLVCMMQTNEILVVDTRNNDWTKKYYQTKYRPKNVLVIDSERTLIAMVDIEGDWHFEIIRNQGDTSESLKLRGAYNGQKMCIQKIDTGSGDYRIIQFCEITDTLQCFCLKGQMQFSVGMSGCNSVISDDFGYLYLVMHKGELQILSPEGKHILKEYFPSMYSAKFASFDPTCDKMFVLTKKNTRIHVIHINREETGCDTSLENP